MSGGNHEIDIIKGSKKEVNFAVRYYRCDHSDLLPILEFRFYKGEDCFNAENIFPFIKFEMKPSLDLTLCHQMEGL